MYYAYFGLNEPPFKITPNTDFFFTGSNRGAVLDALLYTITHGEGIIKVVGEVGSGKTMLCRMLQTTLPPVIESIYLANPSVAPEDVLFAIAFELQLKLPKNADRLTVLQTLQAYLLKQHAEGRQVVIFIEEAQGMPLATLEEIRLLSNLETKQDKLLQIVLFGQPELDENLNKTHIRQLRERITHSFKLAPMHKQDIQEYLMFRLRASGYRGPHLFSDGAIRAISKAAKGLVRRVNILADKALLAAFADNLHQVKPKHVKAAVKDSAFDEHAFSLNGRQLSFGLLTTLLLAIGIFSIWFLSVNGLTNPVKLKLNEQLALKKSSLVSTSQVSVKAQENPKHKAEKNQALLDVLQANQSTTNLENSETKELATAQLNALQNELADKSSDKVANMTIEEVRLQRTQDWLLKQPSHLLTIQIKSIPKAEAIATELNQLSRVVNINDIYMYPRHKDGVQYTVMLYGLYETRALAMRGLQSLPASIQNNQPYFRTIGGIQKDLSADRTY
jgi:MSHA biogenesis protein MshM